MTTTTNTTEATNTAALARMTENLNKVEALGARLTQILIGRETHQSSLDAPNQELFTKAAQSYWSEAMQNPAKLIEHQVSFWSKSVGHFIEAQQALAKGSLKAPEDKTPDDPRFANPLWSCLLYTSPSPRD